MSSCSSRLFAYSVVAITLLAATPTRPLATEYPAKGRCAEQYKQYGSAAAAWYEISSTYGVCVMERAEGLFRQMLLAYEVEALKGRELEINEELNAAEEGIENCNGTLGPQVESARVALAEENSAMVSAVDNYLLSCLGAGATGVLDCVLSALGLSSGMDALRAAVTAYVTAKSALTRCLEPHQTAISELRSEQRQVTFQRIAKERELNELEIRESDGLAESLADAEQELDLAQSLLEACLRSAFGTPVSGGGGVTRE